MDVSVGFIVFVFGAIVGSFLNVVILRHGTGRSLNGRSGCFTCGGQLRWWELVPLLSYIYLRGQCARCGTHISLQYPVVELLTAVLFTLVWSLALPILPTVLLFIAMSLLVVLGVYDFKHAILPDMYSYVFMSVGFLYALWHAVVFMDIVWVLVSGVIVALPIFAIWALSSGRAMGFGDCKLAFGMGLLLGGYLGLSALWYAFVLGALYGAILLARGKAKPKSEIAFGPFLILGTLITFFTHVGFLDITNYLFVL